MAIKVYYCRHCEQFTDSASRPNPLACPGELSHRWTKIGKNDPAISIYPNHRHKADSKPFEQLDALARCLPLVAPKLARYKEKRDALQDGAERTFGVLKLYIWALPNFPDGASGLCSNWLAEHLNPAGAHNCGPLFLALFIEMLKTELQFPDDTVEKYFRTAIADIDYAQAKVTAISGSSHQYSGMVIELPNRVIISIANLVGTDCSDMPCKMAAFFREQQKVSGRQNIFLYLTPKGEAKEDPGDFHDQYFCISYHQHIARWIKACLKAAIPNAKVKVSLRQFSRVVFAIANGNFPWEVHYMQSVEQMILQNPSILVHLDDMARASGSIRSRYYDMFWDAVRQELADTGITIGEFYWDRRSMTAYRPVLIRSVPQSRHKPAFKQGLTYAAPNRRIKPTLWINPYGDEVCISLTLPRNENDAISRIVENHNHSDQRWLAATELPCNFSNDSLSRLIVNPGELEKMATDTAETIRQFIERVMALPRKEKK